MGEKGLGGIEVITQSEEIWGDVRALLIFAVIEHVGVVRLSDYLLRVNIELPSFTGLVVGDVLGVLLGGVRRADIITELKLIGVLG